MIFQRHQIQIHISETYFICTSWLVLSWNQQITNHKKEKDMM
jgi:hypothetical protein